MTDTRSVTVLYLLYNAENSVHRLVSHLQQQFLPPSLNVEAWFVDDGSKDRTLEFLREALLQHFPDGVPKWIHIRPNPKNLGLSGSLNHSLRLISSPYVLTCHVDCFFESPHYISGMVELLERNPSLAAITGKPQLDRPETLSFAQKLNTVANMMDVLPHEPTDEYTPVGFAEGRCDIFRMDALRSVGYYPTELRTSGEDQILAQKFRRAGFQVAQAHRLRYILSTSSAQDTVQRLLSHVYLFGSTQPYISWVSYREPKGLSHGSAGNNRKKRLQLRLTQLTSAVLLICLPFGWALQTSIISPCLISAIAVTTALKWSLWLPQLRLVRPTLIETMALFCVQFAIDLAYFFGFVIGVHKVVHLLSKKTPNH